MKDKLNSFNLENYPIFPKDIIHRAFNELQELWGYQFVINIRSFHEIFCDILRDKNISDENKDKLKNFFKKTKFFSQFISETKDIKYSTLSWIIHNFRFFNSKYSPEKLNKILREIDSNVEEDYICAGSNRSMSKPWILVMLENLINKLFSLKTNEIIRNDFFRKLKLEN